MTRGYHKVSNAASAGAAAIPSHARSRRSGLAIRRAVAAGLAASSSACSRSAKSSPTDPPPLSTTCPSSSRRVSTGQSAKMETTADASRAAPSDGVSAASSLRLLLRRPPVPSSTQAGSSGHPSNTGQTRARPPSTSTEMPVASWQPASAALPVEKA
eukprot:scaffold1519_cov99-Isochrysis_galbana.AAC.8